MAYFYIEHLRCSIVWRGCFYKDITPNGVKNGMVATIPYKMILLSGTVQERSKLLRYGSKTILDYDDVKRYYRNNYDKKFFK